MFSLISKDLCSAWQHWTVSLEGFFRYIVALRPKSFTGRVLYFIYCGTEAEKFHW